MNTHAATIRALLVDDHPAVLAQVQQLLPEEFEVVAALPNGTGLEAVVEKLRPDLVLLDITLPGASGIELAAQLRHAGHACRLVILTVHDDPDYVRAALSAGADGYVLKSRLATDLAPALRAVLAGERFISPCGRPPSPAG